MFFFTRMKLATIDKRITSQLRISKWYQANKQKDIEDLSLTSIDKEEEWVLTVNKFIDVLLDNKDYKKCITKYQLTKNDLIDIYLLMIIGTMPNPLFKTGSSRLSNTLVGSSVYQEREKQLKPLLESLGMYDNKEEQGKFGHRFASEVISHAYMLKKAHDHKFGEITMDDIV